MVSGGRTPAAFLRELGRSPLDWSRIHVTLADERCVPAADAFCNLHVVREAFADTAAAAAALLEIDATRDDAAATWSAALQLLPLPFAAVVLGMGDDGHFASLFPGAPADALDAQAPPACVALPAPVSPYARLSLNLSALSDARLVLLPIIGMTKARVLRAAAAQTAADVLPIAALLGQRRVRVVVYRSDA